MTSLEGVNSMDTLIQSLVNSGVAVVVVAYFLYKDMKDSESNLEVERARVAAETAQTEVMRQLSDTVKSLQTIIIGVKGGDHT